MSICWTEDGFNMAPPEQPTLSEIKTEKEQAASTTSENRTFIFFDRIMSIIPRTSFDGGGLVPEILSQMLLYIS